MPQCMTGSWRNHDNPFGKGSLHGELMESTFRTRRRAAKINDGETERYNMVTKIIDRNAKNELNRKSKVIGRVRKTIEEIQSYQKVLESWKVDDFDSMQWGFKARQVRTPQSFQRYKLETRVYNCGFTKDTLAPEIKHMLEMNRPEVKKFADQKKLLETFRKRSNFAINRSVTNKAMLHERMYLENPNLYDIMSGGNSRVTSRSPTKLTLTKSDMRPKRKQVSFVQRD